MDTLGTEKQSVIQRFPLFRGYLICTVIFLDPQKQSVIERFSLLGEFVKRGSAVVVSCLGVLHQGRIQLLHTYCMYVCMYVRTYPLILCIVQFLWMYCAQHGRKWRLRTEVKSTPSQRNKRQTMNQIQVKFKRIIALQHTCIRSSHFRFKFTQKR